MLGNNSSSFEAKKSSKSSWIFLSGLGLLSLFSLSGCMTPNLGSLDSFSSNKAHKNGSPESQPIYAKDSREASELYESLLLSQAAGADSQRINALLAKREKSSLEEAILVLNLVHNFMASHLELQSEHNFEIPFEEPKAVSLAELSALYNIDLIEQIENNTFLQTLEVYLLLLRLREFFSQDPSDKLLLASIEDRFTYYREFVRMAELALRSDGSSKSFPLPPAVIEDKRSETEKILEEVEDLLSMNKYHEAVTLLQKVPEEDSSYEFAQQKILLTTRKAIEELRKKAALAYQNANQIDTDFQARESYLLQARKFLQTALERYPDAEQISRVKMNLKVIEDNLGFLNKGRLQE